MFLSKGMVRLMKQEPGKTVLYIQYMNISSIRHTSTQIVQSITVNTKFDTYMYSISAENLSINRNVDRKMSVSQMFILNFMYGLLVG